MFGHIIFPFPSFVTGFATLIWRGDSFFSSFPARLSEYPCYDVYFGFAQSRTAILFIITIFMYHTGPFVVKGSAMSRDLMCLPLIYSMHLVLPMDGGIKVQNFSLKAICSSALILMHYCITKKPCILHVLYTFLPASKFSP